MAVIPRYFSGANPTPAINTVRADPSVAAAPYRAQEHTTASLMNQFQHEIASWQQIAQEKDKGQGEAYNTVAQDQLAVQARELRNSVAKEIADPEEAAKVYQEKFQQLADSAINGAPNQQSRLSMIKHNTHLREGEIGHLTTAVKAFQRDVQRTQREQQAALEKDAKVKSGLSAADSLARLQIEANIMRQELLQNPDPKINMANEFDVRYQKLVDAALLNSTDTNARTELLKKAIPLRAQLYNNLHNESIKKNNQENMTAIENTLQQYEVLASKSPDALPLVKENSKLLFESMSKLGVPQAQRDKIQQKFNDNLDYHALRTVAEKDPKSVLKILEDPNSVVSLRGTKADTIKRVAESSLKAYQSSASKALKDVEDRLYNGQTAPDDLPAIISAARNYGLEDEAKDLEALAKVRDMTKGKSYGDITAMKQNLSNMLSSGEIDLPAKQASKLMKYVEGQAKAIQKDPVAHGERDGLFAPLPPITDFTKLSPDELEARKFRASQAKNAYGIPAATLRRDEISVLAAQLDGAPVDQKLAILKNLAPLDAHTINEVSKKVKNGDPGLAHALRIGNMDDELASKIIRGQAVIADKGAPKTKAEDEVEASATALGNLLENDPDSRRSLVQAGKALYAYEQSRGNETSLEEAMRKAGNVVTVDRGWFGGKGYNTVAPGPGMDSKAFNKFTDDTLSDLYAWKKYGNGLPSRTSDNRPLHTSKLTGSDLEYHYRDDGKYDVLYEGKKVLNEIGEPVFIDLRKMLKTEKG